VLVWDVADEHKEAPAAAPLDERELEAAWADLAAPDPIRAYRAVGTLVGTPRQALPLLQARLAAAVPLPTARLIEELDDMKFSVRERATAELAKLGRAAEPALRAVLEGPVSSEVRRRVNALLAKLKGLGPSPDALRAARALEVVEQIGGPEALKILEVLARSAGPPTAEEAKAALRRVAERSTLAEP
jgi:hypothetical protein